MLNWKLTVSVSPTVQRAAGAAALCHTVLGLQVHTTMPAFYVGGGHSYSGLLTYIVSALTY